tara:strand:- start:889 stop:1821 length:933 start_codon:yes stop_codon:yes gene_type:complete
MSSTKLKILSSVLGNSYRVNDENLFFCPFCKHHKRKLSVNTEKNVFKCWICDATGSVSKLVYRYGTQEQKQQWKKEFGRVDISEFDNLFADQTTEIQPKQRIKLPDELISLASRNLPLKARAAMRYLKTRGITEGDILKWKIGFCAAGEYKNRIIFPSFNDEGYCNYFVARTYADEWPKYKNPSVSKDMVFNELYVDWSKEIILVEGVFDAVVAGNAIPLLGSTLREDTALFKALVRHDKDIYIALDKDANRKALKLVRLLQKYNKQIFKVDTSGFEDVGTMTKEEFLKRKDKALPMDTSNYLFCEVLNV